MKEVEERLWQLTVDDLKKHSRKLGTKVGANKQITIENILKFYQNENWLEEYFKTLDGFDKEYTYLIVQQNFTPISSEVASLREKYNIKRTGWFYEEYEDTLKFSLKGFIPKIFREQLVKLVPPIEETFVGKEDIDLEETYKIIESKEAIKKFDDFLKFIISNKVKVTEKTNSVTKANILKYWNIYQIEDITRHDDEEEPKNQSDTIIANGVITLLLASDIIESKSGYVSLGKKYQDYVKLNKVEKARLLLEGYIKSNIINETKRLMNAVYKVRENIKLMTSRETIINYIKLFPVNQWVESHNLKKMLRVKKINFLREATGEVLQRDEYSNWFYDASYQDFEYSFIDSVLMDYLAILGIVDVTIDANYTNYERFYLSVGDVRLTSFGAMVLELVKEEEKEEIKKPFLINEHYEIVIEERSKRMEYELYFERFLDKVKETSEETVYEFSFKGLAKAYDLGINPKNVLEYLQKESSSVPEKLLKKINIWLKSLDKITIKTVTILEAPKDIMSVLCADEKIQVLKETSKEEHIIINGKKAQEVKKQIEQNTYFCKIIE